MCVADESSVVAFVESMAVEMMMSPLGRSPPPPFIGSRRGGYMYGEISEVVVFPPNSGRTVEGCYCRALESMASGEAVVLGSPLALRRTHRRLAALVDSMAAAVESTDLRA
jgi:hypothetical protein